MKSTQEITHEVQELGRWIPAVREQVAHVVIGQKYLVDRLLLGLLANGHILLEGVPGLAKTLSVKTMAACIQTGFQRLQFTPDLLPADLIGTLIYNPRTGEFTTKLGPLFSNLILADEINRAPAKVQSALLEAMQERQVTIGKETFMLDEPFLVLATQNPIEQEGTYPLPEAQVDRFMLKIVVSYPDRKQEREILERMSKTSSAEAAHSILPVMQPTAIAAARELVDEIYMDAKIKDYIIDLVFATREGTPAHRAGIPGSENRGTAKILQGLIQYGASPRATINLTIAAKANAFLDGRGYVSPQDVKDVAMMVLRHRVILTYEAEAEEKTSDDVVRMVLDNVQVP